MAESIPYIELTKLLAGCKPKAKLYIVATPLGNPADITLRALQILQSVDLIAAEDTRVSQKLLGFYGFKARMISYHDHNEDEMAQQIAAKIKDGQSVALISDAGTPLISDPGYRLLQACLDRGIDAQIVPGASAVTAAVAISGLPPIPFQFCGFLPARGKENRLKEYAGLQTTLVFFEAANRLVETLQLMLESLGNRDGAVMRELSKKFEDVRRGSLSDLIAHYTQTPPLGEVTLVIGPPGADMVAQSQQQQLDPLLIKALQSMSLKKAVAHVCEKTGMGKRQVYQRALELQKRGEDR